jgi:hypothetical protein
MKFHHFRFHRCSRAGAVPSNAQEVVTPDPRVIGSEEQPRATAAAVRAFLHDAAGGTAGLE